MEPLSSSHYQTDLLPAFRSTILLTFLLHAGTVPAPIGPGSSLGTGSLSAFTQGLDSYKGPEIIPFLYYINSFSFSAESFLST